MCKLCCFHRSKNKTESLLTSRSTALIALIFIELIFGIGYIKKAVFKIRIQHLGSISIDFDFPSGNEGRDKKKEQNLWK